MKDYFYILTIQRDRGLLRPVQNISMSGIASVDSHSDKSQIFDHLMNEICSKMGIPKKDRSQSGTDKGIAVVFYHIEEK